MDLLQNFLNVRYSTRKLSDDEFEDAVPKLASELCAVDFRQAYTDKQLREDWRKLQDWMCYDTNINSTSRVGMKLCEHFFPNFYDIKNSKGVSFTNAWNQSNLEKILKWNRKSHSTPYLSELKRGVYFCCGLPKSTMYRPQMMKLACMRYKAKRVLDPCAGWGGRMLGAVSSGAEYVAFEPNKTTFENLNSLAKFLNIENRVRIICDGAENMDQYDLGKFDLVLTSPPYFNLEVYSDESTQSINCRDTYDVWAENFLRVIIHKAASHLVDGGVSCWNVAKVGKNDMEKDVERYHLQLNLSVKQVLTVTSSKRQSHHTANDKKSSDRTVVYQKVVDIP